MTITTTKRRGVTPGRLTYEAEAKVQSAIETLLHAAIESEEGTSLSMESLDLATRLQAYLQAYRGR